MKTEILGVKVDNLTMAEALQKVESFLKDGQQHYLVTPNPEFLVKAQKDEEFKEILNQADLAVPDGIGLIFAAWFLGQPLKQRITGVDLVKCILEIAQKKRTKIVVVNWPGGLSSKEEITKSIKRNYPDLKFVVENIKEEVEFCGFRKEFYPDILFVNFGAPYQERFIYDNLEKMPSVKLAMGVGGAFDFMAGQAQRAPNLLRAIGLEWLWRFSCQPWRFKRIFKAVIVFPWLIIKGRA